MTTLLTQNEASLMRDIEAKAEAHLDNLWEDYKIAANTYTKLFDTSVTGVPVTEEDFARIRNAKENAHVEAIAVHNIYEQAIASYRAIGLVGSIGTHLIPVKSTRDGN